MFTQVKRRVTNMYWFSDTKVFFLLYSFFKPDSKFSNQLVLMTLNFNAVTKALSLINASWGLGISARKITVSTVGLPAQIKRLASIDMPITLAISLHAPNDEIRKQLIPWAEYVTIEQLKDAANEYFDQTGREVTLEYILLGGLNDQLQHAEELARLARTMRCNINLIRYNEVKGMPYQRPQSSDVLQFQEVLQRTGINVHIRASRGRDIAAACGQLRHEHSKTDQAIPVSKA